MLPRRLLRRGENKGKNPRGRVDVNLVRDALALVHSGLLSGARFTGIGILSINSNGQLEPEAPPSGSSN